MDDIVAERVKNQLVGRDFGEWNIIEYVDHGKSAIVFKARAGEQEAALKIFDLDLVNEFGRDVQLARIEREKALIGKVHPHLIRILDGGAVQFNDIEYLYIAMDYLPQRNLHKAMKEIPRNKIFQIISQVAEAAKFLEDNGLVHRDIKPDNIAISDDFDHATLLDLGVLRPLGLSAITDHGGKLRFVGTLQYSPPEFLTRQEEDTVDAWRSITFYQLGAVLHDLVMGHRIFDEYRDPYARMVHAVSEEIPVIQAEDVDQELILLAKCCLVKDPTLRLECLSWDDFLGPPLKAEVLELVRERVKKKQCLIRDGIAEARAKEAANQRYMRTIRLQEFLDAVKLAALETRLESTEFFPPFQIQDLETSDKSRSVALAASFGPSGQHSLSTVHTVLLVAISLTDSAEELLELECLALASPCAIDVRAIDVSATQPMYKGPYDEGALRRLVKVILFRCLEQVLDFQTSIDARMSSPGTEASQATIQLSLP